MKFTKTILLGIFLIASQSLFSQDSSNQLIKIGKDKFEYKDKTYNLQQLMTVFSSDEILSESYDKAMHTRKVSKILGYGTIGLIVFGAGAVALPNPNCDNCIPTIELIGAIAILLAPITGSYAILRHFQYKSKFDKVINGFNESQVDSYGRRVEEPTIGLSTKGVGFKISF